jgi:membrane protein DedA with SNARE-associated domain
MESTWLQTALDWVQLHPNMTGLLIFLVALGESFLLVGILLPGAAMLVGLGTLIGLGVVDFKTAWITASLGAFAGDGISFWIGYHYKQKLLKIWPIYKFPKLINSGQTFFSKWGTLSVFVGRFVGLVRPIIPAIAGMMAMPLRKYLIISTIAAILWSPFYLLPGMLFGNAMGAMSKVAGKLALLVVIFVTTLALIYWLMQLIYGFLLPRTHRILSKILVWSQKHPLVGKVTSGLIDPRKPEKGSLAFMATFIIALTITSLFVILNSQTIEHWSIHVSGFMQAFHTDWTEPVMLFILALTHDLSILVPSLMVFIWLMRRKRGVAAGHWGFIVISGYILALLINYFSTDSKHWFGFHHLTWFVSIIAFWAALISGSLPHKLRSWPYTLATLLIAMVAFAQLFFLQMSLGIVLISIFSAILWSSVVAIAYRMRVRKQFLGWPVSAMFFSFQGITVLVVLIFFAGQLKQHNPIVFQEITQQQWLNGVLEERNDWLNRPKQAFQLRFTGDLSSLSKYMESQGFSEHKPKAWKDVWRALNADKDSEYLPIIPATNKGKIESVIYSKASNKGLIALHLWQEPYLVTPEKTAVYAGYVSFHKRMQKYGLTFWQAQDDELPLSKFIEELKASKNLVIIEKQQQYFIQNKDIND